MTGPARVLRRCLLLAALAGLGLLGPATTASAAMAPGVTVIGDSVQASFDFAPQARARLGADINLRLESAVCRRLSSPSCAVGGRSAPESALTLIRRMGPALGRVVVINVGYNDDPRSYGIDRVLAALHSAGVEGVVWATLRERHSHYATTNAAIRSAAKRTPGMVVVDWNASSAGLPVFAGDGLHLSRYGAYVLAGVLRAGVAESLAQLGVSIDGATPIRTATLVRVGAPIDLAVGDGTQLWTVSAGRLTARDERQVRAAARPMEIGTGGTLLSDGRAAWLSRSDDSIARLARSGTRVLAIGRGQAVGRTLARSGSTLWLTPTCTTLVGCRANLTLEGITLPRGATHSVEVPEGTVEAMAASRTALWTVVTSAGSRRRHLQLRSPLTGLPTRSIPLPGAGVPRALTATAAAAWLVTARGGLIRVGRDGDRRRVMMGIRRLTADGEDELWALLDDRRTLLSLDPASGRPRARARSGIALSKDSMTLTRSYLWARTTRARTLVRIPRSERP